MKTVPGALWNARETSGVVVLCFAQDVEEVFEQTLDYVFAEGFSIYTKWLNPGPLKD